jgi:DNA-binding MarR family transcriptional regulator
VVDVARESGQHKQVVGTLVDELERLGYVRREPDPNDRPAKLIVPTELGLRQMAHDPRRHLSPDRSSSATVTCRSSRQH